MTLRLPPLSERPEDLPRLFQRFVTDAARRFRKPEPEITTELLIRLGERSWAGNLRELRNAAELYVLGLETEPAGEAGPPLSLTERVDRFERDIIASTLAAHRGNLKDTYETLGVARKTLYEKMRKHGLSRDDF